MGVKPTRLQKLLTEAWLLGLGKLTWTAIDAGWSCVCSGLRFPHRAEGETPLEALDELVRFARRI